MTLQRPLSVLIPLLAIACALLGAAPARAQMHGSVPSLPEVRSMPGVRSLPAVPDHGAGMSGSPAAASMQSVDDMLLGPQALTRKLQIATLLREEPERVGVDPHGAPILLGQFLAMGLSGAQLDTVQAQGFVADRAASADATLGLDLVVLHDTQGRSAVQAMRALQQLAPNATFAYQHLYLPSGAGDAAQDNTSATGPSTVMPRRVGLIDGGVDPAGPALAHAHIEPYGCKTASVSRHGTAVAARLVDGDTDALYAADLWCGNTVGGETSSLVEALAWMAREHVPVINISLVGPDNPVLARAVQAMIARGHVLVAAVGNDGPAAPPLFPAAYPGVIGVSGVDAHDRVLPESGSGDQVAFCALGVVGSGQRAMRGTSFAAPIVARRAAQLLDAPRKGAAEWVLQRLASEARDLGPPGRDPRYGYGLLSP